MAGAVGRGVVALLIALFLCSLCECSAGRGPGKYKAAHTTLSISDVNILLPFSKQQKVRHRIYTQGSCFQWSASNEVVSLTPVNTDASQCDPNSCSDAVDVEISPSFVFTTRSHSWIQASEARTGKILTCEVYVDRIDRIEIETTTRTMFKGDLERLTILAFDSVGNLFTNIDGLKFHWALDPVYSVLQFAEDSTVPQGTVESGEDISNEVFVQAENIGTALVTTQLVEEGKVSKSAEVSIGVIVHLNIEPQMSYVAPGASFSYTLLTHQRNSKPEVIPVPDSLYLWSSTSEEIATIKSDGRALATQLGTTSILVKYHSPLEEGRVLTTESSASAVLHVVPPHHIGITISIPGTGKTKKTLTSPVLIVGRDYIVDIVVYSTDSVKFHRTDNLAFGIDLPETHFRLLSKQSNFKSVNVHTREEGVVKITGSLLSYTDAHKKVVPITPHLTAQLKVPITSPVTVSPTFVKVLCSQEDQHSFPLFASGGTGEYEWSSADTTVVTVDSEGKLGSNGVGKTIVTVKDSKNRINFATCSVVCAPPDSLLLHADRYEVQVGHPIIVYLGVLGEDGKPFYKCPPLEHSTWSLSDQSVFTLQNKEIELPEQFCSGKLYFATKEGHSRVSVSYLGIRAEVTIFAFRPLTVVEPLPYALITLGTSVTVTFDGGPDPWFRDSSIFFQREKFTESHGVQFKRLSSRLPKRYSYQVTCLSHSVQHFVFEIGNAHTTGEPTLLSASAEIRCQPPSSLLLFPLKPQDIEPSLPSICPESWKLSLNHLPELPSVLSPQCTLRNDRDIPLGVTVFNEEGRNFDDFSSLNFEWISSDQNLKLLEPQFASRLARLASYQGTVSLTIQSLKFLEDVLDKSNVKAHYRASGLADLRKKNPKRVYDISLLPNVHLIPESITLVNHPDNKANLTIEGGSGFFSERMNATACSMSTGARTITLSSPLYPSVIQVSVVDGCLGGSTPATSLVHFSNIGRVEVNVSWLVELENTLVLQVIPYDDFGNQFHPSQLKYMTITVHADDCLELIQLNDDGFYQVKGKKVATGLVVAVVAINSATSVTVTSEPKEIVVFPPFKLIPSTLYLLPGAGFQVQYTGGPPFRPEVSYFIENNLIASVDSHGYLSGKQIGQTRIKGSMESYSMPDTVFWDSVPVTVLDLKMDIVLPTEKLLVGNEMEACVYGMPGMISPFAFGDLNFGYEWSVVDEEIAIWKPRSSDLQNDDIFHPPDFSVRLIGKKAGNTRIRVTITSPTNPAMVFRAEAPVVIYDRLELISPSSVLVTPSSSFQILTNKDHLGHLTYNVLIEGRFVSGQRQGAYGQGENTDRILEVSPHGDVITFGRTGEVYIQVSDNIGTSVVVHVNVKPVDMIQVLPTPPLIYNMKIKDVAEFEVLARDDFGRRFDYTERFTVTNLLNKPHVVNVNPGNFSVGGLRTTSLLVTALSPGEVVLRVSFSDKEDWASYIRVRVGESLLPKKAFIHLGGTLSLMGSNTQDGYWWSNNQKVLSVNSRGVVKAESLGTASIFFDGTHRLLSAEIEVVKVTSISAKGLPGSKDSPKFVTNFGSGDEEIRRYRFPLEFFFGETSFSGTVHNIQASCSVEETQWARARVEDGLVCVVETFSPYFKSSIRSRSPPDALHLEAKAWDASATYTITEKFTLPFSSAFVLAEQELTLSPFQQSGYIHVFSARTLEVTVADPNLARVARQEDFDFDGMGVYIVSPLPSGLDSSWETEVVFSDPSRRQTEQVKVVFTTANVAVQAQKHQEWHQATMQRSSSEVLIPNAYPSGPAPSQDESIFPYIAYAQGLLIFTLAFAIIFLLAKKEQAPHQGTNYPMSTGVSTPLSPQRFQPHLSNRVH